MFMLVLVLLVAMRRLLVIVLAVSAITRVTRSRVSYAQLKVSPMVRKSCLRSGTACGLRDRLHSPV
jgi:hypothetical protein